MPASPAGCNANTAAVSAVDAALAELIAEAESALGIAAAPSGQDALAAEAASQGAFNEETGEINWDCPVSAPAKSGCCAPAPAPVPKPAPKPKVCAALPRNKCACCCCCACCCPERQHACCD